MTVECILINTERMDQMRRENQWSLYHEGALGTIICLVGLCEGPIYFDDNVIAAMMKTKVKKWLEWRDDLIKAGAICLTDEGRVYLCDEGDFFKFQNGGRRVIPSKIREAANRRHQDSCAYCGTLDGPFHHDHLMPVSRGGDNDASNIVLACRTCNTSKGDKTLIEWCAFLRDREVKQ